MSCLWQQVLLLATIKDSCHTLRSMTLSWVEIVLCCAQSLWEATASRLTKISPESSRREQRRPLLQGPQLVFQLAPLLQGLVPALLLDHGCILLAIRDHWEGALWGVGDPLQGDQIN